MNLEEANVREASRLKASEIIQYVQDRIDSGDWPNGYKIPTEKSISSQFAAARNTVRKALSQLESEGVIERHVGRGTFVRGAGDPDNPEGASMSHLAVADASPADVNEIRVLLEPAIAGLAVTRAARSDILHARNASENRSLQSRLTSLSTGTHSCMQRSLRRPKMTC